VTVVWDVGTLAAAVVATVVAIGGYVQFGLVRAKVAAQFDIEFVPLGRLADGQVVGDVSCLVTNLGSSPLLVTRVAFRYRYSIDGGEATGSAHNLEPRLGLTLTGEPSPHRSWVIVVVCV
jgi:hypothetical protein